VLLAGGKMDGRVWDEGGVDECTVAGFCGETMGKGTRGAQSESASSPTRRLFVSIVAVVDNLMVGGADLVPKDGE